MSKLPLTPTEALQATGEYHPAKPDPAKLLRADAFTPDHYLLRHAIQHCTGCQREYSIHEFFLVKLSPTGHTSASMLIPAEQRTMDLPIRLVTPKRKSIPACSNCWNTLVPEARVPLPQDEQSYSQQLHQTAAERATLERRRRWEVARQQEAELIAKGALQRKPRQERQPPIDIMKLPA